MFALLFQSCCWLLPLPPKNVWVCHWRPYACFCQKGHNALSCSVASCVWDLSLMLQTSAAAPPISWTRQASGNWTLCVRDGIKGGDITMQFVQSPCVDYHPPCMTHLGSSTLRSSPIMGQLQRFQSCGEASVRVATSFVICTAVFMRSNFWHWECTHVTLVAGP